MPVFSSKSATERVRLLSEAAMLATIYDIWLASYRSFDTTA
jgi:hypothetical protein